MDIYTLGIVTLLFILYFVPYLVIVHTFRRALPRPGRDLVLLSPPIVRGAQTCSILNDTDDVQSKIPTINNPMRHRSYFTNERSKLITTTANARAIQDL
jgi:hypothetical protein